LSALIGASVQVHSIARDVGTGGRCDMATFSTWDALRTAIKDQLQTVMEDEPCIGEFQKGDFRIRYDSKKDLMDILKQTYELEAQELEAEQAGAVSVGGQVSYGKRRRFN
jgi:thiamine pyrophosphokinase